MNEVDNAIKAFSKSTPKQVSRIEEEPNTVRQGLLSRIAHYNPNYSKRERYSIILQYAITIIIVFSLGVGIVAFHSAYSNKTVQVSQIQQAVEIEKSRTTVLNTKIQEYLSSVNTNDYIVEKLNMHKNNQFIYINSQEYKEEYGNKTINKTQSNDSTEKE